jgi:hypothetical protein
MLGEGSGFAELMTSAKRLRWDPLWLWPDVSRYVEASGRAAGAQPALPNDVSAEALEEYRQCVEGAGATECDRPRQFALLASARLLVTALENAGREVNREKLVETLENLRDIRSGYARLGSFSSRRHTAAAGVYIVSLSPAADVERPEVEWMSIE